MTRKERESHAAFHLRAMKRMEAPFISPIAEAVKSHIDRVAKVLKEKGIAEAIQANEKIIINEAIYKPVTDLYKVMGLYMYRRTTREINRSARAMEKKAGFGLDFDFLKRIIAFLNQFAFSKVVLPITQTTRKDILEVLIEGQNNGWGVSKIIEELDPVDMSRRRAETIVRTESLRAMQYGQESAARDSRWQTEKRWISAHDSRTRTSHRIVDGMKVDEGQRFPVPIIKKGIQQGIDLMLGPGDPQASAGNVINCRCTLVTVAKRDARGRLVKKQNQNISLILE